MIVIRNLNQHAMDIGNNKSQMCTFAKSEAPLFIKTSNPLAGTLNGIPVFHVKYEAPNYIPEEQEGVIYLANMINCQWFKTNFPARQDMVGPSQSKSCYDADGKRLGVGGLIRYTDQIKLLERKEELGHAQGVEFVNLTGSSVVVAEGNMANFKGNFADSPEIKVIAEIAAAPTIASVDIFEDENEEIEEISIATVKYGNEIIGLPAPEQGKVFIVSSLIAQLAASLYQARTDIICPAYGPGQAYRDKGNTIRGTVGFIRY